VIIWAVENKCKMSGQAKLMTTHLCVNANLNYYFLNKKPLID